MTNPVFARPATSLNENSTLVPMDLSSDRRVVGELRMPAFKMLPPDGLEGSLPSTMEQRYLHHHDTSDVTYKIVTGATKRGKDLLVDSLGYKYVLVKDTNVGANWRCSVRTKTILCKATVVQEAPCLTPNAFSNC